jgi:hypothetical protein
MKCPHCNCDIRDAVVLEQAARIAGKRTSKAKAAAARANGAKGGRPRKRPALK